MWGVVSIATKNSMPWTIGLSAESARMGGAVSWKRRKKMDRCETCKHWAQKPLSVYWGVCDEIGDHIDHRDAAGEYPPLGRMVEADRYETPKSFGCIHHEIT